jgi:hypothetical protein
MGRAPCSPDIALRRCRVRRYTESSSIQFAEQAMQLTPAQLAQYERDSFLNLPRSVHFGRDRRAAPRTGSAREARKQLALHDVPQTV